MSIKIPDDKNAFKTKQISDICEFHSINCEKINNITFTDPKFNIVNNVKALPETDAQNIKNLLIDQIFKTVKWRESIIYISNKGVSNFIEIGPGKVLTGMVKRTLTNAKSFSINSIADIKNLINEFKK